MRDRCHAQNQRRRERLRRALRATLRMAGQPVHRTGPALRHPARCQLLARDRPLRGKTTGGTGCNFTMPVEGRTSVVRAAPHLRQPVSSLISQALRRSTLSRGNCWHTNRNPEAGPPAQRAAPLTVPSGAPLLLCSKGPVVKSMTLTHVQRYIRDSRLIRAPTGTAPQHPLRSGRWHTRSNSEAARPAQQTATQPTPGHASVAASCAASSS